MTLRPQFQRLPYRRLPEREAVTIAIGIRYCGGALLCADTEITRGESLKTQESKIYLSEDGRNQLAITYSGSVSFAKMFIDECQRTFPDFPDKSKMAVRQFISERLLEFHKVRVYPHPRYQLTGGPDFQLMVGIWSEVDGLDLFFTEDTAVNSIDDYQCMGIGEYLARFIIEQDFKTLWTRGEATAAAQKALKTAKHYVPYCGGGSDFFFLEKRPIGHGVPVSNASDQGGTSIIELEAIDPSWLSTPEGRQRSEEIFRRNADKLQKHVLPGGAQLDLLRQP
jgi:20S proteasome alpha/beta subunit